MVQLKRIPTPRQPFVRIAVSLDFDDVVADLNLSEKLLRLTEEFADLPDRQERLSLIVERAKRAPTLAAAERTEAFRVPGCIAPVWLVAERRDHGCFFRGDAQGPVVRGLVIFLCAFYSGATPAEIFSTKEDPLEAIEIAAQLSPTRRNGLSAFRNAIRDFARAQQQIISR